MSRRLTVVGIVLAAAAGVVVGASSNWTRGLGTIWFGASFVVLLVVAQSFREDINRRFENE